MTGTDIATTGGTQTVSVLPYSHMSAPARQNYAHVLAGAGDMIPAGLNDRQTGRPSPAKIFLVLETGAMLGLHPMAALNGIDVIEGKATISPRLFTGLVRGAGHKLRINESGSIGSGDYRVDVVLIRKDDPDEPIAASWDMDDTVQAELAKYEPDANGRWRVTARSNRGNALNWEKFPKDMCLWRALGRLARRGAADVLMGIGYFPEELEVAVDEEGERVDYTEREDAIIAAAQGFDDKADMAGLYLEHHPVQEDGSRAPSEVWTGRVQAAFDAHLATLTKDSRPPKAGAPGQTGDALVDGGEDTIDAEIVPDDDIAPEAQDGNAPEQRQDERQDDAAPDANDPAYLAFLASQNGAEPLFDAGPLNKGQNNPS